MAIDPYSPCPGGLGKKIKFCCSDLMGELERIQHMLEGEQRQACLDHIKQIEGKYPNRACLETTKASLETELGKLDEAEQTLSKVLAQHPANSAALAEAAIVAGVKSGPQAAIAALQKAIAAAGKEVSPRLYDAVGMVVQLLLESGHLPAARGHLLLQLRMQPQDEMALELLVRINASPTVSILLKNDPDLVEPPADVSWRAAFNTALEFARQARWAEAAAGFTSITERVITAVEVWRNLAVLRGWLADHKGMAVALHRLSSLAIPLDDAVEAEATALLIDPDLERDTVDQLVVRYTIRDFERIAGALPTSRQTMSLPVESFQPEQEGEPPPRSAFWLLDRPVPETGVGIAASAIPQMIGRAFLFGRQTDREARLEVEVARPDLPKVDALLSELAPGALDRDVEEIVERRSLVQTLLSWNWRLPDDTPRDEVQRLVKGERSRVVLEIWPQTPLKLLGGKTPVEAAKDGSQRVRLLATILQLELALGDDAEPGLLNQLRQNLGLPQSGPIDPTGLALDHLPPVRFARLMVEKLSDEDLIRIHQQAMFVAARPTLRKTAAELIARPSLAGKFDKAAAFGLLASLQTDPEQALAYLGQAREAAQKANQSCARWDLEEFTVRVQRGDSREASALLEHLQSRHGNEPGVRQTLMQLFYEAGLIDSQGRSAMDVAPPLGGPLGSEQGVSISAPGAAPAGKIWTPGGDAPAGKKSALWTPGME